MINITQLVTYPSKTHKCDSGILPSQMNFISLILKFKRRNLGITLLKPTDRYSDFFVLVGD
ncbi:hypothetical protein VCRA2123O444_30045 [Vibrio crassostreae]|nr:hypothetical protein VCRA2113O413_30045 [Vibrio crassostreae]CAK2057050.1 hypothetical protein VCRA2113O409_30045 [Vibrio crassostreae]CAK2058662.1 hypothetical protein VCRA2113O418_30045 [Vibrio crassostreae]CAK2061115.1 hypothetical protein VCRA2119O430_30045 [Vibrio crassostreae]CAK2072928.1 hypothetical protein VCRA2119O432_30274 [Vibrio crassostreae]